MLSPGHRIGILGGGQLARMLVLAGAPLGFEMSVLSESPEDPAAQVCRRWQQGGLNSPGNFFQGLDALTFESEFFNTHQIDFLLRSLPTRPFVFPSLENLGMIQDRRTQKAALVRAGLPTAPFQVLDTPDSWERWVQGSEPQVVKKARGGYDGNGTFYARTSGERRALKDQLHEVPCIVEDLIPFDRELALMVFRSRGGEVRFFPLVETEQVESRCDLVVGPIPHTQELALRKSIENWLHSMGYVGALGVELFDRGGQLIINELAPRVHNSGHYSQTALNWSQFHFHLLCSQNDPLPELETRAPAFAMANLIGQGTKPWSWGLPLKGDLHWYGKNENRKGRKMGHLNVLATSIDEAREQALRARKEFAG